MVRYDSGWETVAFEGLPTYEREVHDMDRIEEPDMSRRSA